MGLSDFDYVFLSFEMGLRKPNDDIYLKVQEELKVDPENILLIDDTKENIETAKRLDWNMCQATGNDLDLIKETVNNFIK